MKPGKLKELMDAWRLELQVTNYGERPWSWDLQREAVASCRLARGETGPLLHAGLPRATQLVASRIILRLLERDSNHAEVGRVWRIKHHAVRYYHGLGTRSEPIPAILSVIPPEVAPEAVARCG